MRRTIIAISAGLALGLPFFTGGTLAQLRAPDVTGPVGGVADRVTDIVDDTVERTPGDVTRTANRLLRLRDRTLSRLLRRNSELIERDANGDLARRGELVAMGLDAKGRAALLEAGFTVAEREEIEGLGLFITALKAPAGVKLAEAQALAQSLAPDAEISPDNLHFPSGEGSGTASTASAILASSSASAPINMEIGVIDTAPGASIRVSGEGAFAKGAPKPADHGSAVVSLLSATGARRIRVADVYGTDPAGGNALAIARALGWLTKSGSRVVTISLVGPRNTVLARAIAAARKRGVVVVAAVGNDGPAAPPAYPASYSGVIAVTGVDRKGRALIEAGRALDLDYAGPGDRVYALDRRGKMKRWRGTSFATPLVAARIASALGRGGNWRARVDAEARDLGKKGADKIYGRGLVCAGCGQKR
ncbi:MAG: S8 family serine peptidase [Pseudomonadota bacterium]